MNPRPDGYINRFIIYMSPYRLLADNIFAQSKFETANFTSNIFLKYNNMFGMTHASHRYQLGSAATESPDGGYYQRYSSTTTSLRDYLIYLDYVNFPNYRMSSEEFVTILKNKRYFTANLDLYIKGVNHYKYKA